ncbi:uncharacterized protein [Littorina saxatilis]|uniref:uncharacterized protein n=1 Tax=Littorina saxatilis TaxID=31220 RepID=UPI0038B46FBB
MLTATPQYPEASDPSSCDVLTTTAPGTVHTTSSTNTHLTPPSTAAPTTVHTTPSTTTHLTSPSTAASTSSQPPSTRKSTETAVGGGDRDSNVGVIIGASVAAVAAVVVFVIVVMFYRRKFQVRKPKGGKRNLIGKSAPAGADNPALGPDDPYELAEDGAPGQNRNSRTDDYTYIGTEESSHQTHHQANGTLDDDYSCIGDTQHVATGVHGMNTAPAKPDPRDVYSVVNKPGKKTPTPGNSLAKIVGDKPTLPNPNDVYSVVNKKGKKPDLAPKPGHSDTEYNTISHKANDNSSQKIAGTATSDTYNRIGEVASLGSKGKSQESALAEKGSLVDEYNTLDFADTRQNASRKETSGAARAAYDHVRNDSDDPYSKTQIGKRNVVIGSDYDHVKP